MEDRIVTEQMINDFVQYLYREEKSDNYAVRSINSMIASRATFYRRLKEYRKK